MVLEKLFPKNWTEHKLRYTLLIGIIYSSVSILISTLLFGKNSGLISVVLTSLLILPLLGRLLSKEEAQEEQEKTFSVLHLFRDNKNAVVTYFLLFISIFFTYALYVFIFHLLGINILSSFHGQLLLDFSKGGATFMFQDFWTILSNNWWVLLTIFIISLFVKEGGIFFVVWNASSWGVILSYRAITSAGYVGGSSLKFFFIILGLTTPFLILEALAYIMVAISGNIISDEVVKKSSYVHKFIFFSIIGAGIILTLHFFLNFFGITTWLAILLQMIIIITILMLLSKTFLQKKYREAFIYNFYLFIFAVLIFIAGALLEVLIMNNVDILTKIYSTSLLFTLPV